MNLTRYTLPGADEGERQENRREATHGFLD